jgi:hypothetical protein
LLYASTALGLQIFDVSDPAGVTRLGGYDTSSGGGEVQVVGNLAYVADHAGGLKTFDVSDPATVVPLDGFATLNACDVQVVGHTAYVADDKGGLKIFDVSDPAAATHLGAYATSGYLSSVQVVGDLAYLGSRCEVVDVSNPAAVTRLGKYGSGLASDVYVVGNSVYVAIGGIEIYEVGSAAAGISHVSGDTYRVDFGGTVPEAEYALLLGPEILDATGAAIDQDQDGMPRETPDDVYFARFNVVLPAEVVGRHVFYNNSKWDGHAGFDKGDPAANEFDDGAIATDKEALLPGQTGTFANYTSYPRGINGIMVDIQGLADPIAVADGDLSEFDFRYGNDDTPGDWLPAPAPLEVTVRDIGGGVHRITFVWADKAIPNKNWVQVTVKSHPNTGLAADDVFYFGNTIGENTADFRVDYSDAFDIIWPLLGTPLAIGPDHVADINRDGRIDYSDVFDDLWPNLSGPAPLKPIHPPALPVAPLQSTESVFDEDLSWAIELLWFDALHDGSAGSEEEEDGPLEATAVNGVFSVYCDE